MRTPPLALGGIWDHIPPRKVVARDWVASARPSMLDGAIGEELIDLRCLVDDHIGVQTKARRAAVRRSRVGQRRHDPLLSAGRKKGGRHARSCSLLQQQIHDEKLPCLLVRLEAGHSFSLGKRSPDDLCLQVARAQPCGCPGSTARLPPMKTASVILGGLLLMS